ncbi:MAG TPA: CaiB/BaiF CoA-transferase family protein [Candidatus Methylomirabilis sp.]|nr:CaiB/BaiF CoA-transferase family protein [Candidatus Methylomirabilis sp.]
MRPLDGITVLTLEHAVSAPFATRHLADLGARVIKVERPDGGDFARGYDETVLGLSSYFVWLNRSKESLSLNLKHPRAREILTRLLERTDVFVQNLAPGATGRLGLGWEELLRRQPRLIVCDISGYGDSGPYRDKKAYDLLIQSEAGLLTITGSPDTPSKAGISIADIAAGTYAYSGILSALYQREKTGQGMRIQVSMLEALGEWMGCPLYYSHYGGAAPPRTGASHATIYPYGPFRTGDGKSVMLGVQNEREWAAFCDRVLGCPEMARDPRFESNSRRVANRATLGSAIERVFSSLTAEEVLLRLEAAQVANARVNQMEEVWKHPQFAARGRWREVQTPAGTISALLPPATLSTCEASMGGVPALGQHTDAVLSELGFSTGEITELRAEAVV